MFFKQKILTWLNKFIRFKPVNNDTIVKAESKIFIPKNLNGHLETYQKDGFRWMVSTLEKYNACLLADDMGLGKTIQAITLLLHYKNNNIISLEQKVLLIVPKSIIMNWVREFNKFAPSLKCVIFHPKATLQNAEIILVTYATAMRYSERLNKYCFSLIILDEAQNIKNVKAAQSKKIKRFVSKKRIALTGTPLENYVIELINILDFLRVIPINSILYPVLYSKKSMYQEKPTRDYIKTFFKPYILRRIKQNDNILLPPIKIETINCVLSNIQRKEYKKKGGVLGASHELHINKGGLILVNKLKLVCNYGKVSKPICYDNIHSTKFLELEKIIANMKQEDKMIIFTHSIPTLCRSIDLIKQKYNFEVLQISGKHSSKARLQIVDQFQNNSNVRVLIISTKAGGVGLNLTGANHVIHFDLWWNPMVEDQATARAYRRGQTRPVFVYRFVTLNTVEESLEKKLTEKRFIFQEMMNAFTPPHTDK